MSGLALRWDPLRHRYVVVDAITGAYVRDVAGAADLLLPQRGEN